MIFKKWNDKRKRKHYTDRYYQLCQEEKHAGALNLLEIALKDFPDDLSLLYFKAKELIAIQDAKGLSDLFESIKKIPEEKIKNSRIPKCIEKDMFIKDENDLNDENIDPLISDKDLSSRKKIKKPKDFIETIIRRNLYMCLKFNGRIVHGKLIMDDPKMIRFLVDLNIKYISEDKDFVLYWFYREADYALQRGLNACNQGNLTFGKNQFYYAIDILKELIDLTKDDKDELAHLKYYSLGLAYNNVQKYELAIKYYLKSLHFTKDKSLIAEVNKLLEKTRDRQRHQNDKFL